LLVAAPRRTARFLRIAVYLHQEKVQMPSQSEIFEKVRTVLTEALGVDEEEVTSEATLVGDLGAESIDFLDIVFRLEKAFDIKISRTDLFPEEVLTSAEYVQNGKVNAAGIAELKKRVPFVNLDKFAANPNVKDFGMVLTVQDMVRFVEMKNPK
jgi:acyl carrier protein